MTDDTPCHFGDPHPRHRWWPAVLDKTQMQHPIDHRIRLTCPGTPSFTCPDCGATSYHPEDVRHGYCGACHAFTGDV